MAKGIGPNGAHQLENGNGIKVHNHVLKSLIKKQENI